MKPIDWLTGGRHSLCIEEGVCTQCSEEVVEFKDELSAREYKISGLCQKCQDKLWPREETWNDC